jgi:fermentation-respiration switch protein FrsA (DUF1100 family)
MTRRMLIDMLGMAAIAYACVLLLVFAFQSRLVFYPGMGREMTVTPQAYGLDFETVELATEDGDRLHAWWVPAQQARGTVLIFHGNAGNISHRIDYLQMFHRLGYSSFIFDYRGYGRSSGSPSEEGTYRDASAAWDHLTRQRAVPPGDIVYFGESLGGAVASWLAVRRPPRALVLASSYTSATDLGAQIYWFLPVRLISRIGYDNLANLRQISTPVLIAHSRDDEIVPFAHGETLFAAVAGPRQFLEMRGGHNEGFVFARREWADAVAAFLRSHAASGRTGS